MHGVCYKFGSVTDTKLSSDWDWDWDWDLALGTWDVGNLNREYPQSQEMTL